MNTQLDIGENEHYDVKVFCVLTSILGAMIQNTYIERPPAILPMAQTKTYNAEELFSPSSFIFDGSIFHTNLAVVVHST